MSLISSKIVSDKKEFLTIPFFSNLKMDPRAIEIICAQKVQANRTAVNWLVGLGVFFLILGIVIQIVCGSWGAVGIWALGLLLLIIAGIVYAAGAADRDCFANPHTMTCRLTALD